MNDEQILREIEADRLARTDRILKTAGVPRSAMDSTIDGVKSDKTREFLTWYFEEGEESFRRGDGICIFGDSYTGKTSVGSLIARHLVQAELRIRFTSAPELQRNLAKHEVSADDVPIEEKCLKTNMLFVDDLGREHVFQTSSNLVIELLLRRMNEKQACCIMTHLSQQEVNDKYGPAFLSRIISTCHILTLKESYVSDIRKIRGLKNV